MARMFIMFVMAFVFVMAIVFMMSRSFMMRIRILCGTLRTAESLMLTVMFNGYRTNMTVIRFTTLCTQTGIMFIGSKGSYTTCTKRNHQTGKNNNYSKICNSLHVRILSKKVNLV
jgi:hypothetical protein